MRFCSSLIRLILVLAASTVAADAQTVYWDIDTQNVAGAGGGTAPSGTWSASTHHWNADSTGVGIPTAWVAGETAIFSAGTNATGAYTVTVSGTQNLAGLTVEEGAVTQSGGTLDFGAGAASIYIDTGASYTEASTGLITGTGGIFKNGTGTLYLRGTNSFGRTGAGSQPFLSIKTGIVDFTADPNLGAIPAATDNGAALTINGGTLRYSGNATVALAANRGMNIGTNGGTIQVVNPVSLALAANAPAAAALTGSGTLTKTGIGRFRLQAAQTTFTGKYVVKGGSLAFPDQNRLGAIPAATQADYFTLDGGGILGDNASGVTLDAKRGITIGPNGGYLAFYTSGLLPYDGIISGSQGGGLELTANDALTAGNTGTISLNSANTYNGPTQIDIGMTLSIGVIANGGANSGIGSSSNAAANLILNGGKLSYRGPAASTDRNFTITIAGGYIESSNTNNSSLSLTSTAPVALFGNANHLLILGGTSTGDNSFSPALTDLAAFPTTLNKADAGTWVLNNTANSYTGNTMLGNGRLKLGAAGVIPDASLVQCFAQSILDLNGFDETVRSISGSSGTIALGTKTLALNNPSGETYSAAITGVGGGRIVKNGAGKLTLSPTAATYDGGLTLNAGVLGVGTSAALGTGTLVVNNSATLSNANTSALTVTNAVTLNGDLKFDDSFVSTPGSITWGTSGANHWTITGASRTITVNTAAGAYGVTINQPIGQDASGRGLTKAGNGKLTLAAVNTYTGNTTIQGGTLSLAQPSLADASAVFMATGATLNLTFPNTAPDVVSALYIDGALQSYGIWGAIGSAAAHQTALITGTGLLQAAPLLPGDFNGDAVVDNNDYLTWRKNYGASNPLLNDNGLGTPIGMAHLNLWRQNFGNTPASGTGGSQLNGGMVPEPATIVFGLSIGLLPFVTRRSRSTKFLAQAK
jgi:fibronectin-binding autotransporter adhesin